MKAYTHRSTHPDIRFMPGVGMTGDGEVLTAAWKDFYSQRVEILHIPHIDSPQYSAQGANGKTCPIVEVRVYNGQFKVRCGAINGTDIHHLGAGEEQS